MPTTTGKTQMAQTSVLTAGNGEAAWNAEIADGDFRTYVLLCQMAWQEQPHAPEPYTERSFADLARLHPARQRPTSETVRGRLYRLSKAGLVRRERQGRTTWRTYPLVDGLRLPVPDMHGYPGKKEERLAAREPATGQPTSRKLSAHRERGQKEQLAASHLATSDCVQAVTAVRNAPSTMLNRPTP